MDQTLQEQANCTSPRPWFLTAEGRQYYYDDPEHYPYTISEIAHSLGHMCRYAGHINYSYSVGQHSVFVARVVEDALLKMGEPDHVVRPICRAALLHDASEAFLVDIPRPMKRLPEMAGYRAMEERHQRAIMRYFGLEQHHELDVIKEADNQLLVTEKRDLRNASEFDPIDLSKTIPWIVKIVPLSPPESKALFIAKWTEYGGQ